LSGLRWSLLLRAGWCAIHSLKTHSAQICELALRFVKEQKADTWKQPLGSKSGSALAFIQHNIFVKLHASIRTEELRAWNGSKGA